MFLLELLTLNSFSKKIGFGFWTSLHVHDNVTFLCVGVFSSDR